MYIIACIAFNTIIALILLMIITIAMREIKARFFMWRIERNYRQAIRRGM